MFSLAASPAPKGGAGGELSSRAAELPAHASGVREYICELWQYKFPAGVKGRVFIDL